MIGLLQRVAEAKVCIAGETVGQISSGLLVLIGIEKTDGQSQADRLLQRLLGYRVFPDDAGRMNLGLAEVQGGLLLVPQFTLVADTDKGLRPGFSSAAPPLLAETLFDYLLETAHKVHNNVAGGVFGADMQVSLVNDGPVTFHLRVD